MRIETNADTGVTRILFEQNESVEEFKTAYTVKMTEKKYPLWGIKVYKKDSE